MKKTIVLLVTMIIIIDLSACGNGWKDNTKPMGRAPQDEDIPPELVIGNIKSTSYTAIVYIEKARTEPKSILDGFRTTGYVNHAFQARVIETIRGPRLENISFSVMAESDSEPYIPGYPVIVSLCGNPKDGFYVPDNGYELPAADPLIAAARSIAGKFDTPTAPAEACKAR